MPLWHWILSVFTVFPVVLSKCQINLRAVLVTSLFLLFTFLAMAKGITA